MSTELENHFVKEELQIERRRLSAFWNDDRIYDCTPEGARLVLIYSTLEARYLKRPSPSGRTIVCWNRTNHSQLCLYRLNTDAIIQSTLEITPDGFLLSEERGVFKTPDDFLVDLTLQSHIVHQRIKINPDSPLGNILELQFDYKYPLFCPPEYPPLLVHIAMANHDYAIAAKILDHPLFAGDPANPNHRLTHLLEETACNAVLDQHAPFLAFLLKTYPSLANNTKAFVKAIQLDQSTLAKELYAKAGSEWQPKFIEEGLLASVNSKNKDIFYWLIDLAPTSHIVQTSQFLASVLKFIGPDGFTQFVEKSSVQVLWEPLIQELLNEPCLPSTFLSLYTASGHAISNLSPNIKAKIMAQGIEEIDVLTKFFDEENKTELLNLALYQVLDNEEKVIVLVNQGAIPTKDHFESLLKYNMPEESRLKIFEVLAGGIKDPVYAKSVLSIASAFGDPAIQFVYDTYPEFLTDETFLGELLSDIWKGPVAATDRLLQQLLSTGVPQGETPSKTYPESHDDPFSLFLEEQLLAPALGNDVSTDLLIEVFLPRQQLAKIESFLHEKEENIYEFWWKAIFSGFSDFQGEKWSRLAAMTFGKLEKEKQCELVKNCFYYSHLQLASLLMLHCHLSVSPKDTFEWFEAALKSHNEVAVDIFAEHQLLFQENEKQETFLHLAVKDDDIEFVKALLAHGIDKEQKDDQGHTAYMYARANQCLSLCYLLEGESVFPEIANELSALSSEEVEVWLFKALFNGSSADVIKLIGFLPSSLNATTKSVKKFIETCATLIVRFPSPISQKEMHICYGKAFPDYETQQKSWGETCEEHYQKLLKDYLERDHVILELLMKFAKTQNNQAYDTWRMGSDVELITHFHGRYFYFWRLVQKMYRLLLKNPSKYKDELVQTDVGYKVLYECNGEVTPLSALQIRKPFDRGVFKGNMFHTRSKAISQLFPHLNAILDEIKAFKLDPRVKYTRPPEELKQKIALLFWLGCHLVVTTRGSSQYMLMLHRLLHDIHGFKVTPWSQQFVQPDCVAIMLPFSIFYEEYYDMLFESFQN